MGLLDRLDKVDRRLGLASERRRPSRVDRWVARHPWLSVVAWTTPPTAVELASTTGGALARSLVVAGIFAPFGYLLALDARWKVERWERGVPAASPAPEDP